VKERDIYKIKSLKKRGKDKFRKKEKKIIGKIKTKEKFANYK